MHPDAFKANLDMTHRFASRFATSPKDGQLLGSSDTVSPRQRGFRVSAHCQGSGPSISGLKGLAVAGLVGAGLVACGGSSKNNDDPLPKNMDIVEISNGFGLLVPHQVFRLDSQGVPTPEVVAIRDHETLIDNVTALNPMFPVSSWSAQAELPSGSAGNHFIYAEFTRALDVASVLDSSPTSQSSSGLIQSVSVLAIDPATGDSTTIKGRAFVGGRTFAGTAAGSPPELPLQQWVSFDSDGNIVANDAIDNDGNQIPDGLGFPGTEGGFSGSSKLLSDRTLVFIVDNDANLATHETFPANRQIRMTVEQSVLSVNGEQLARRGLGSSTVGSDTLLPEVSSTPPPNAQPLITPGQGQTDVDPRTAITVRFSEAIQPSTLGSFPGPTAAPLSAAINVNFGPPSQVVNVPFTVLPPSVFDMTTWELTPSFDFPGAGPAFQACGTFNEVTVLVNSAQFQDLAGNSNQLANQTKFFTGEGPGLVNAPVAPDAIYVGRLGATPSLSVVDLNGFGASTGNPTFDLTFSSFPKGNSNFPNNPNIRLQGALLRPPLTPGTCTVDGGSAGAFTLTRDSNLDDQLVSFPLITSVGDMMLGWPLDTVFNNGQDSSGCQAGGGNLCAITGLKLFTANLAGSIVVPAIVGQVPGSNVPGASNPVSWAPHPNPPPLVFPPLCVSPFIGAQEPTSIETTATVGLTNLLVPGLPLGNPLNGVPPSGLLARNQNAFFVGPGLPGQPLQACQSYIYRQQIGHFLYLTDRARREVVILNSNRMTVLDRIAVTDPTDLAIGPNMDLLAVSNQNANTVSFIDIDPSSGNFHTVVKQTTVGAGPRGIAWDPGGEDIIVTNENDNSVSIISGFSLEVRKTVQSFLSNPFDVAITQRQVNFGFQRNVYFAYILNRNGDIAIFESGPNGTNGWGFDDIIGVTPFNFDNPKRIAYDPVDLRSAVWVLHENQLNSDGTKTNIPGGAATLIRVDSAISGALPLNVTSLSIPQFRDLSFRVSVSIGPDQLTGVPVDLAFDNLQNLSALPNQISAFGVGFPIPVNGKSYVRTVGGAAIPVTTPSNLFLAVPASESGPGALDVLALDSGYVRLDTDAYEPGVQSIPVAGATIVMDYFRQ